MWIVTKSRTPPPLQDTFKWTGSNWVDLAPTVKASIRFAHAMADDTSRNRLVGFGGTVGDGDGGTSQATARRVAVNTAPVARVVTPLSGFKGSNVSLDGSGSGDSETPGALVYRWSLLSRPAGSSLTTAAISPNNSGGSVRSLFRPDLKGAYSIELTVDDGHAASSAIASLLVSNSTPVASLPLSASVTQGDTLELDGTASSDIDTGDILSYSWTLRSAPVISQLGSDAIVTALLPAGKALFSPDVNGTYRLGLTVSDGTASSASAEMVVVASPFDRNPFVAELIPSAVKTTRTSSVAVLGAGFEGLGSGSCGHLGDEACRGRYEHSSET